MRSTGGERRGWAAAVAVGGILVLAGCGSSGRSGGEDPATTVPATSTVTAPPGTTPTTGPIPLDQTPPVIDLAYAQRVLDQISQLDTEASLLLYKNRRETPDHEAMMTAIYFGDALADARKATETDLSLGLSTWRDPPGPTSRTARRLLSSRAGCIALLADSDYRARYKNPVSVLEGIGVILQRNTGPTPDDRRINPSLWIVTVAGPIIPGKNLSEACE